LINNLKVKQYSKNIIGNHKPIILKVSK